MSSILEKLENILRLEEENGHRNQAVLGGLERFAPTWTREAAQERPKKIVESVASLLQKYSGENPDGRRELVHSIRRLLLPPKSRPQPSPREIKPLSLNDPVTALPGIRQASAQKLARLEIETLEDLLYHFPHRYEDYSSLKKIAQLQYGQEATIIAHIEERLDRKDFFRKSRISCLLSDGSGTLQATWFNLPPYFTSQLKPGNQFVFSGQVTQYRGRLTMVQPSWENVDQELIHTGRLVPVYPLTQGVGPRWLRRAIKRGVDALAPRLPDPLPEEILRPRKLLALSQAIQNIHFPESWDLLHAARRRLTFDEFLTIQLGVLKKRQEWKAANGRAMLVDQKLLDSFKKSLPFSLTTAQERVLAEILDDMQTSRAMSRLLQGDVGSGKTVVAAAAMLVAVSNRIQAALMAPTEILAEQHFATLQKLYTQNESNGVVKILLLTGSLSPQKRQEAYAEIARGEAQLIIGTHALIQAGIEFHDLGLVIIDEQHRFGVRQRQTLREKGTQPHLLVMSATPIPRTLALTLYGDLD
ncbi:MAG: DEAD/DEAH box helicase, partial [Chloroflexi bacterium]|nr:DEAD/DEAH box helicase [Chloroflexota bacterium]